MSPSPPSFEAVFSTKKNPFYLDTLETNGGNQENQDVADSENDLEKRLSRYGKAKKRGIAFSKFLQETGRPDLAGPLRGCGDFLTFHDYFTAGKLKLVKANFCNRHLLCGFCAIRRGAKYLRAYLERLKKILESCPSLRMQLVTFTVKNGDDLGERFAHLSRSLQILRKRKSDVQQKRGKSEWGKVLGAVGAFEVTNKGRGWHPHAHIIVLSKNGIDLERLRDEWKEITGDSFEIDVSDFQNPDDPVKDFCEVFKYSVAFSDLTFDQNLSAYEVFKGRRLVFSQGLFRGVPSPESLADDPLKDLPYVVLMYRYCEKAGYLLKRNDLILLQTMKGNQNEKAGR